MNSNEPTFMIENVLINHLRTELAKHKMPHSAEFAKDQYDFLCAVERFAGHDPNADSFTFVCKAICSKFVKALASASPDKNLAEAQRMALEAISHDENTESRENGSERTTTAIEENGSKEKMEENSKEPGFLGLPVTIVANIRRGGEDRTYHIEVRNAEEEHAALTWIDAHEPAAWMVNARARDARWQVPQAQDSAKPAQLQSTANTQHAAKGYGEPLDKSAELLRKVYQQVVDANPKTKGGIVVPVHSIKRLFSSKTAKNGFAFADRSGDVCSAWDNTAGADDWKNPFHSSHFKGNPEIHRFLLSSRAGETFDFDEVRFIVTKKNGEYTNFVRMISPLDDERKDEDPYTGDGRLEEIYGDDIKGMG